VNIPSSTGLCPLNKHSVSSESDLQPRRLDRW